MNAIALVNLALHALALCAAGWVLVRWCISDARHRAWGSLLVLLMAVTAPFFMARRDDERVAVVVTAEVPVARVTSWKPDWRIPTSALTPVRVSLPLDAEPEIEERALSAWSAADVAGWICILWIAGGFVMALRHAVMSAAAWRWRRTLRCLSHSESEALPALSKQFRLRVFEGGGCPCVVGLRRPAIAVPKPVLGEWSRRQWEWLLRHEGSHVEGRDTLVAWLLGWMKALLWWNPFVHALGEQWSQAREEICDGAALRGTADAAPYSRFLLDIAAGSEGHSPALLHMAASRPARRLKARMLAMLAGRRVRRRVSPWFLTAAMMMLASVAAILSCMGLKAQDAAPSGPKEMETRSFKVAPDFLGRGMTAREMLVMLDIPLPEGATAAFVPATSQLVVKNTVANLERLAVEMNLLKAQREAVQTQAYISSKWIEMDEPTAKELEQSLLSQLPGAGAEYPLLTDPQFQVVIRFISQRKGVDLMTAPSVTTRLGQRATVEVIREVPGKIVALTGVNGQPEPRPDFVGVSTGLQVNFADPNSDYNLALEVNADLGEFVDPALRGWRTEKGFKVPDNAAVVHVRKDHKTTVPEGSTLMMRVGQAPGRPGRVVLLFVTARLINPAGEMVGQDGARERAARERPLRDKVDRLIAEATDARKAAGDLIKQGKPQEAHKKLLAAHWGFTAASSIYPMWKAESVSDQLKEVVKTMVALGFPPPPRAIVEAKPAGAEGEVLIDVKWIDFPKGKDDPPFAWLQTIRPLLGMKPVDPAVVAPAAQTVPEITIPPGVIALTGVFTDKQFATLLPTLLKQKNTKLTSAPPVEIPSGEKTDIKQEGVDDFKVTVEPVIGPEGYTIDLNIGVPRYYARKGDSTTTAVTIWSGQTVALGGSVQDEKNGDKNRLVFITARLKKDPPKLQPR